MVLNVETKTQSLGGRVICEGKGKENPSFTIEVYKLEEHEYNKLIFY